MNTVYRDFLELTKKHPIRIFKIVKENEGEEDFIYYEIREADPIGINDDPKKLRLILTFYPLIHEDQKDYVARAIKEVEVYFAIQKMRTYEEFNMWLDYKSVEIKEK